VAWDGNLSGLGGLVDAALDNVSLANPLAAALLQVAAGSHDVSLSAWAIDNAAVEISANHRITGDSFDGVLVEGVKSGPVDPRCGCTTGTASLLISANGTGGGGIGGGEHGIQLAQGVDLDLSSGHGGVSLSLDLWAILDAAARIVGNGPIQGSKFDGIFVRGVLNDGSAHTGSGGDGGEGDSGETLLAGAGDAQGLLISGNDRIEVTPSASISAPA
jgi:hypothetical protein